MEEVVRMSPHYSRLRGASRRRRILPVSLFLSLLLCTARLATSGPLPPNAAAAARGGPGKGSSVVGDVVVDDDEDDDDDVESAAAEGTADETKDADGTTTADDDENENEAIESIVSKITSWTKEKHRRAKRSSRSRKSLEEDGILELQRRRPPRELPLPFVTLAYAQTLDGMIAAIVDDDDGDGGGTAAPSSSSLSSSNLRLSGPESTILTHRLRSVHDAILVGGTTFLVDGPRLNVRLPKEYDRGVGLATIGHQQQPVPVVLDTHLNNLQTLLFGEVIVACDDDASIIGEGGALIPDMGVEKIRARHPVVCCTSDAAHSFLDTLEIFQEQQSTIRKPKRSYKITVYKKIDEEFGHERDIYLPIKISVRVTTHGNSRKHQEDVVEELTFTLLPCPTTAVADGGNKAKKKRKELSSSSRRRRRLDLRQVLCQLRDQFDVGSVMVEGGAGILSSFLNEQRVCVDDYDAEDGSSDCDDGASSDGRGGGGGTVVDCVCVTIAPGVIGGKQGLPALGGLDTMRPRSQSGGDDDENYDNNTGMLPGMVMFRKVEFVPLGLDCTFLGRL